jgi:hypothetical protein
VQLIAVSPCSKAAYVGGLCVQAAGCIISGSRGAGPPAPRDGEPVTADASPTSQAIYYLVLFRHLYAVLIEYAMPLLVYSAFQNSNRGMQSPQSLQFLNQPFVLSAQANRHPFKWFRWMRTGDFTGLGLRQPSIVHMREFYIASLTNPPNIKRMVIAPPVVADSLLGLESAQLTGACSNQPARFYGHLHLLYCYGT